MWKLVAAVAFLGAIVNRSAGEESVPSKKEWRGMNAAQEKAERVVVEEPKGWEDVWSRVAGNVVPKPATPDIDFTRNRVAAVFMGRKRTGGFSVQLTAREEGGKVIVKVNETHPRPGAIVTQALTSPYHVLVVPKTDEGVEFENAKE